MPRCWCFRLYRQTGRHRPVAGTDAGLDRTREEQFSRGQSQALVKGRMMPVSEVPTLVPAARAGTARRTRKARILLVDDDERNLMALSEVLKDLAQVVTATSGREA